MFHSSGGDTTLSRAGAKGLICDSISENASFIGSPFILSTDLKNYVFFSFQAKKVNFTILQKSHRNSISFSLSFILIH